MLQLMILLPMKAFTEIEPLVMLQTSQSKDQLLEL